MKTKFPAILTGLLVAAACSATPLMETTAIHPRPDVASPAIGYLKAGTDPVAAADATAPAGWMAVDMPGPHEAYVNNNDFSKSLDIHMGAAIRLRPKADAPLLALMQEGDKTEITGLRSGWTQIKLYKTLVGYIQTGGTSFTPVAAPAPAPGTPSQPQAAPAPDAPPPSVGAASDLPRTIAGHAGGDETFSLRRPPAGIRLSAQRSLRQPDRLRRRQQGGAPEKDGALHQSIC